MQRTSESIAKIAGALAKAQAKLQNPEKTLTATIPPGSGGGDENRSYRYASLASGLEIIRKCLSQHEIATVQATGIERDSGLIKLTTTLVHGSGEWIASDWPVCPVSETATPQRMGAALSYARKYALFALVGIAGEDDLDGPDPRSSADATSRSMLAADRHSQGPTPSAQGPTRKVRRELVKLTPDASARLRQKLLFELEQLTDHSSLTTWAQRIFPLKNQLSHSDAEAIEATFVAKLKLQDETAAGSDVKDRNPFESDEGAQRQPASANPVVFRSKPVPERDRHHLKFVTTQSCLICGRIPSDAHHLKFAEQRAMGRKVSDKFTVPVCRLHHRELHRRGNERAWWDRYGIEPLAIAARLWEQTHRIEFGDAGVDQPTATLNGAHFGTDAPGQNDEAKPV